MSSIFTIILLVLYAILLVYQFGLIARRWHDLGYSGWMSLLSLIPILNIVAAVFLLFIKGDEGANQYGAPNVGQPFWRSIFSPGSLNQPVTLVAPPPPTPPAVQ